MPMPKSLVYWQMVLGKWARINEIYIGEFGHAGASLSVCADPLAFVIDQRGHNRVRLRTTFPFVSRKERREAWPLVLAIFFTVTNDGRIDRRTGE